MFKYSEPRCQRWKTFLNGLSATSLLHVDEYESILCQMSCNMKCPDENLIIKNESKFLVSQRKSFGKPCTESKRSSNDINKRTSSDGNDEAEKKSMKIIHSDKHSDSKKSDLCNDMDNKTMNQNTLNILTHHAPISNENKKDLQSLLIMMTIDSLNDNVEQSGTEKENNVTENTSDNNKSPVLMSINQKELSSVLKIIQLKKELNIRQKYIMKKYVQKWKNIVKIKKDENKINERQETVTKFLNNLAMKKENSRSVYEPARYSKMMAQDYKTYQHRYKVQKQIIALQKAKLEQQHKMIEELKLNKIVESSSRSLQAMKENIRDTYHEVDRHLKPKLKILSNELKIKDLEDPSLILHCLKVPQFLQRMEARAREREEKHAVIRERRRQLEEERSRLKQQEELAKAEMNKEEKALRIKELKEKRKKEKIEAIRKKQHTDRMRALIVMADLHYEKNLTAKYGIRPFKLLMKLKEDCMEKAKAHYTFQVKKNVFLNWMWYTEDMWYERKFKAEEFYRKKMLKKVYECLKRNHYEFILKRQVAEDYYDFYVTQLVFRKLREAVTVTKKHFEIKWKKAEVYHNSNLLFKAFTCWRTLPALNALQREQEARKLKWRQKVLQVVPDYTPPEDYTE